MNISMRHFLYFWYELHQVILSQISVIQRRKYSYKCKFPLTSKNSLIFLANFFVICYNESVCYVEKYDLFSAYCHSIILHSERCNFFGTKLRFTLFFQRVA